MKDECCEYAGSLHSFLGNLTDRCECPCHEWICDEDDTEEFRGRW